MMSGFTFWHIGSKQLHRCVNCPVLRIYDFPGGDMIQCIRILFRKIDGEHDGECWLSVMAMAKETVCVSVSQLTSGMTSAIWRQES